MVDYIYDILKQIYHLSEKITPVLLPTGALIIFATRGKIKLYFQRSLLRDQEKYKKELELYKSSLLREFEEHKSGIDVRKHLSIEMSNKRLVAYQKQMEFFLHFRNLSWLYNKNPNAENKDNIFGKDVENGWSFINAIESNFLFFSDGALNQFKTKIAPTYQKVLNSILYVKPIDEEDLKDFDAGIKKVKEYLISEIFPGDPTC